MTIKNKIKPNEELYGDFADKLIPLNLDAVQQRIDFFRTKVENGLANNDNSEVSKYFEPYKFWENIREEHCEVEI